MAPLWKLPWYLGTRTPFRNEMGGDGVISLFDFSPCELMYKLLGRVKYEVP